MNKELALTDPNTTYYDIQKATFFVADKKFNIIGIPLGFIAYVKSYIETMPNIKIAVAVDFPNGLDILEVRQFAILQAIRKGANIIDIPVNNNLAINNNWKAFKTDAAACLAVCKEKNVESRFILDYRLFDTEIVIQMCKTLESLGVDKIITTNGIGPDEPFDNIIIAENIKAKTGVLAVVCSSMLKQKHLEVITNMPSGTISGYRLTSIGMAELIFGRIGV